VVRLRESAQRARQDARCGTGDERCGASGLACSLQDEAVNVLLHRVHARMQFSPAGFDFKSNDRFRRKLHQLDQPLLAPLVSARTIRDVGTVRRRTPAPSPSWRRSEVSTICQATTPSDLTALLQNTRRVSIGQNANSYLPIRQTVSSYCRNNRGKEHDGRERRLPALRGGPAAPEDTHAVPLAAVHASSVDAAARPHQSQSLGRLARLLHAIQRGPKTPATSSQSHDLHGRRGDPDGP